MDARAQNRALLARQLLLERSRLSVPEVVEALVGLQSQAPQAHYAGLWSRIEGFDPAVASQLLESRALVRIALMRGTIHLVTAEDARFLRPLVQPVLERALRGGQGPGADVDLVELAAQARALVEEAPRTFAEIGAALAARWPGEDPERLSRAARCGLALAQVPPRGLWGRSGPARHTTVEKWLGAPLDPRPSSDRLVLRYLAAFGPATVADAQAWSGLTRLREVFDRLGPALVRLPADDGRTLWDLPDAPRPDAEVEAPVRLLADFDNLLLSHVERTHVVDESHRRAIFTVNGIIPRTVLVDGRVAGTWTSEVAGARCSVRVASFARLSPGVRDDVEREAHAFAAMAAPGADVHVQHAVR
ncbi:winged helix DNA-binding protein [Motilibacter peucedani]|uniref:Winged helix DNA-binding protein n=1 Tax=Motilibacter peucedani TaxID=598650 RepID=A0A420XR35_9ACTN|nr:winged helix DNA-binding domain-containing protein [Motilibacter peucedani]RKS75676.1 winged helix DNA-binding protein [Motilibacter peucedani]